MKEETMGQRIQRHRVALGLTQTEVAKLCGIPSGSIRNWEQDRREPSLRLGVKLAKVLRVSTEFLADTASAKVVGRTPRPAGPTKLSKEVLA